MMARLPALYLKMTETVAMFVLWASSGKQKVAEAQRAKRCKQVSVILRERAGNLAIISAVCRPSGERYDNLIYSIVRPSS